MERCSNCIMPAAVVPLAADGRCAICHIEQPQVNYKGQAALEEVLDRHKRLARLRGARYDCLVSVSGGKDSTYTLHQLVTRYGMRALAFNYDHAFAHPTARENLQKAVTRLGVELVANTDDSNQRRYLRRNLLALSQQSGRRLSRLWTLLCTTCGEGYSKRSFDIACQHNISLVVQGGCPVEPDIRDLYASCDLGMSYKRAVLRRSVAEIREVLSWPIFYDPRYYKNVTRYMFYTGQMLRHVFKVKPQVVKTVSKIHFFQYVPYDEEQVVATLERELDWQRPPGRSTTTRFDCKIHLLIDGLTSRYLGASDKENMLSAMIRCGMITRDEALGRLNRQNAEEHAARVQALDEILRSLDLQAHAGRISRLWQSER